MKLKLRLLLVLMMVPLSLSFGITLLSDALAAYNMESLVGGTLRDVSGQAYDAINGMGGTSVVQGPYGNALAFDGTDQICIAHTPALKLTAPYTVEAMFRIDGFQGDWVRVVGKGQNTTRHFGLWYHPTGRFLFQTGSGSSWGNIFYDTTVQQDRWYHLAGIYTGSALKLYLDGTYVGQTIFSGTPADETEPLTIGGADFHNKHIGLIDNVAIYDFTLSDQDISRHAQGLDLTVVPEPASWLLVLSCLFFMRKRMFVVLFMMAALLPLQAATLALWGFNEGSGSNVADLSGNNNNLSFSPSGNIFSLDRPGIFSDGSSLKGLNYATIAAGSSTNLNWTGNVFTMEAWIKAPAPGSTHQKFLQILGKTG